MTGTFFEAKNKKSLIKRFKRRDNIVFVDLAGKTLQKKARKGFKIFIVIVDKKKR